MCPSTADSTNLPDLTPWKPMKIGCWLSGLRTQQHQQQSGSMRDRRSRESEKIRKQEQQWQEEQRRRRRIWPGSAHDFKLNIDLRLGDPDGHESTLLPMQAKAGKMRWLWSSRRLKGAIEIQEPDGEVFIRGNQEQQLYLIEFLSQFTHEWHGVVPKSAQGTKSRSCPEHGRSGRSAGVSSSVGSGWRGRRQGGFGGGRDVSQWSRYRQGQAALPSIPRTVTSDTSSVWQMDRRNSLPGSSSALPAPNRSESFLSTIISSWRRPSPY